MTRILLALLTFYQRWLSPALHTLGTGGCKYLPTCSEYAVVAISNHGPLRGTGLAIWRVLRCNPFARGGLDPVPVTAKSRGCCRAAPNSPTKNPISLPHQPLP